MKTISLIVVNNQYVAGQYDPSNISCHTVQKTLDELGEMFQGMSFIKGYIEKRLRLFMAVTSTGDIFSISL